MPPRIPTATYRLQFNQNFTLKRALELVPYFHALGISDLYCSPLFKSVSGSIHGYDVVDYTELNPEIGSEEDLSRLASALHERQMGILLDFIPNHMRLSEHNQWWLDVLENGPSSLYANHFNIIWSPPTTVLKNKVLLPVLQKPFGEVLENQELELRYIEGSFFIVYKEEKFPLNPSSWQLILKPTAEKIGRKFKVGAFELEKILDDLEKLPLIEETDRDRCLIRHGEILRLKKRFAAFVEESPSFADELKNRVAEINGVKGSPGSFNELENLLAEQAYRISDWRVTNDEVNYFRFFDISTLITMRTENPIVFQDMHTLLLKYIGMGWISGLRIDHIDGLYDPEGYLSLLQKNCAEALKINEKMRERGFFIIVEKILGGHEKLRPQWLCSGTTGYDFLNQLNALFVQQENEKKIRQVYDRFDESPHEIKEEIYQCKKLILSVSMASNINLLADQLERICAQHRDSHDFTLHGLRSALREVIACFPVYRSYIRQLADSIQQEDRKIVRASIAQAKQRNLAIDHLIFDFIQSLLLWDDPPGLTIEQISLRREFVMRFQQVTGPAAAKGVEDTALYRIFPLASLNEVGMDPETFGIDLNRFHALNRERLREWPHTLIATSTHDNKRSEDVRARLNVLSEDPGAWQNALLRWSHINQSLKTREGEKEIPDLSEEYLLYQTLVGSWPLECLKDPNHESYITRLEHYMIKAIKEAKIHSDWINPQKRYEASIRTFIHALLKPGEDNRFLKDFKQFLRPIAKAGLLNSLAQILLKITSPGIPDFYQGNELWEFSLVDPDNRHAIDYNKRIKDLQSIEFREDPLLLIQEMFERLEEGRIKLYLISKILNYRKEHPLLFQEGEYLPLSRAGENGSNVVAYSRMNNQQVAIAVSGRFFLPLFQKEDAAVRNQTDLLIPKNLAGNYRDLLSGLQMSSTEDFRLPLPIHFNSFPLMFLVRL